jgi:hypothetical protein
MLRALALAVSLSALAAPAVTSAAQTSLDHQSEIAAAELVGAVTVGVETINGSGCPAGSATVTVAEDQSSFSIAYKGYQAQVGPQAEPTDIRKNCALSLRIQPPSGYTYAVVEANYHGLAYLAAGATATMSANYYLQGSTANAVVTHPFGGPYFASWEVTDVVDPATTLLPCGTQRNLNINTELRANAGTSDPQKAASLISMDSMSGTVKSVYHLAWKQC